MRPRPGGAGGLYCPPFCARGVGPFHFIPLADVPLKSTVGSPARFWPVMVTVVTTAPEFGVKPLIVGVLADEPTETVGPLDEVGAA
jgi:hypothetical protein